MCQRHHCSAKCKDKRNGVSYSLSMCQKQVCSLWHKKNYGSAVFVLNGKGTSGPCDNPGAPDIFLSLHTGWLTILTAIWEEDLQRKSLLQSKSFRQIHYLNNPHLNSCAKGTRWSLNNLPTHLLDVAIVMRCSHTSFMRKSILRHPLRRVGHPMSMTVFKSELGS